MLPPPSEEASSPIELPDAEPDTASWQQVRETAIDTVRPLRGEGTLPP